MRKTAAENNQSSANKGYGNIYVDLGGGGNEQELNSQTRYVQPAGGSMASDAFQVNDRTGGSDQFQVNDRSAGSDAFQVNDRTGGSD